jgi:hypothetical protein
MANRLQYEMKIADMVMGTKKQLTRDWTISADEMAEFLQELFDAFPVDDEVKLIKAVNEVTNIQNIPLYLDRHGKIKYDEGH